MEAIPKAEVLEQPQLKKTYMKRIEGQAPAKCRKHDGLSLHFVGIILGMPSPSLPHSLTKKALMDPLQAA
jgi:hypothetical protein